MRIIDRLDEMTETARGWLSGGSVGFVPIISSLHEGHRALVQAARAECEISVVSIILLPLKMNTGNSGTVYPRDLSRDLQFLSNMGIDVVFVPPPQELYPQQLATYVALSGPLAQRLEQRSDADTIREFATVMAKLFLLVRPDIAFVGQKDAQQVAIIRQIVHDLNIDVNLRVLSTVRESSGLALSSRNLRLSWTERQVASVLYQALLTGRALVEKGEQRAEVIKDAITRHATTEPLVQVQAITITRPDTLAELAQVAPGTIIVIEAQIGDVYLTDNILWDSNGQWII
jgi:pantoate--beta-alanine ligase